MAPKFLLTHNPTYYTLTSVFVKYLASRPLQGIKIVNLKFLFIWLYLLTFIKLEIKIKKLVKRNTLTHIPLAFWSMTFFHVLQNLNSPLYACKIRALITKINLEIWYFFQQCTSRLPWLFLAYCTSIHINKTYRKFP